MRILDRVGKIAPTRPNWSNGVTVEYSFKTSIFQSRNNTEQREAMRERARISVQFLSNLRAAGYQRLMADIAQDQTQLFVLPIRHRSSFLTSAAGLGASAITITDPPFWLTSGCTIVITDEDLEEAFNVLSVISGTVTLDGTLSRAYGAGSRVMAAYSARLPQSVQFQADLNNLWSGNMRWDVDPGSEPQGFPASTPPTHEGRELFLTKPNWQAPPRIDFDSLRDIVDAGRGVIEVSSPVLDSARQISAGWTGMDVDAVEALIAFFLRMKGQRTGFFMPSWQEDITVTNSAASSSSTLLIDGSEFHEAYSGSTVYNVLIVFFPDGSYQVNRIVSTGLSGLDSQLTMRSPWNQEVNSDCRVMFCHHMRFASDVLNVQYVSSITANIEFALRSVQAGENE